MPGMLGQDDDQQRQNAFASAMPRQAPMQQPGAFGRAQMPQNQSLAAQQQGNAYGRAPGGPPGLQPGQPRAMPPAPTMPMQRQMPMAQPGAARSGYAMGRGPAPMQRAPQMSPMGAAMNMRPQQPMQQGNPYAASMQSQYGAASDANRADDQMRRAALLSALGQRRGF